MHRPLLALLICFSLLAPALAEEYKTADDAIAAGAIKLRTRNYTEAIPPLEKALAMTPAENRKKRCDIYEALTIAYRQLPEIDKMQEAAEYLQVNNDSRPGRSLMARSYTSFLYQRGRTDWAVKHYEEVLKKDPRDPTALAVLSAFLSNRDGDEKKRGEKLKCDLKTLNDERSAKVAEAMEATADKYKTKAAFAWKDIARIWLEADETTKAKAALEKARKAPPEERTKQLTRMWHEGMGDSYAKLGDVKEAVAEYEAALKLAEQKIFITGLEKKIKEVQTAKEEAAAEPKKDAAKPGSTKS